MTTDNEDKPVDTEVASQPEQDGETNQTKDCTPQSLPELATDENNKENNNLPPSESSEDNASTTIQSPASAPNQNSELNQVAAKEPPAHRIFTPFSIFKRNDEAVSIEA